MGTWASRDKSHGLKLIGFRITLTVSRLKFRALGLGFWLKAPGKLQNTCICMKGR